MDRGYERYNRGTPYSSAIDSSLLSDDSVAAESPANLFSKKATHDTNVHPELRRLAFLLQSELGRHEQQIAKIQYEERKMAIERAFNAVTPLKLRQTGSANRSANGYGSPDSSFRGDISAANGSGGASMIRNRQGGASIGSENSVLEELDLVASQNAARNNVLMGLSGSGRNLASGPQGSGGALAFSDLFFGAALQLLEEESEKRRNKVGMTKTDFQQLIKSGILEKSHGKLRAGMRKYNFVKKRVEVKAGKLLYYKLNDTQSMKFGNLFSVGKKESERDDFNSNLGNAALHKGDEKVIDFSQSQYLIFPYNDVRGTEPGHCFVMYNIADEKESRVWRAEDAKSCTRWMTAIRTAIRINRATATSSADVKVCNTLRSEIMAARVANEYVSILKKRMQSSQGKDGLRVPVAWVHSEMEKVDKDYLAAIENDMTIEQMKKDMLRDTFQIDGALLHGVDGVETIVGTLAAKILRLGEAMDLKEIHAVRFAREVLYECSRSQFGGDCFYTARFLCSSDAMDLVITPQHAAQPLPIIFTVSLEPYMEEMNIMSSLLSRRKSLLNSLLGANYDDAVKSNQHQSALLTVHMEASMVFEMNDMDFSSDGKLATIETKFKRSFVFAGERPVAVGAGNIHVTFRDNIGSS